MTETNQLLRDYVDSNSESAFREIVSRYVDLVYSVAFRRIGGNEALARDIVQAVFTDLAGKARRLRSDTALGGWLHRHTCFVSSTVRRAEERRLAREKMAVEMNQWNEPSDASWQQLAPILDEAIDQLGEADRQAIILRFYERHDLRTVGAALGTNEDAAQKRLSRALVKLRVLLSNKGVSLSVAGLTSILPARAVSAAPAGLVPEFSRTAVARRNVATGGFIASSIALMTSLKIQLGLATLAIGLVVGALVYSAGPDSRPTAPKLNAAAASGLTQPTETEQPALRDDSAAPPPSSARADSPLQLTILAADSGRPVPGVQIAYRGWEKERFGGKRFTSNRDGMAEVVIPRQTITHLELTAACEGFADTKLDWQTERGETIPAAYTLRLARPVPISGRVLDPDGQPVAGAKMGWNHQDDPTSISRPESHEFGWIEVETDSEGRWRINRIAAEMLGRLYGSPRHPDLIAPSLLMVSEDRAVEQQLRDGTHVFRMGRALSVSGTVGDREGKPVPDAKVLVGGVGMSERREAMSSFDGSFTVKGCKPGKNLISAEAPGYAAATVEVDVSATTERVQIILQRGKTLRLRLVNKESAPIAGANVWYDTMRGDRPLPGQTAKPVVQAEFNPKTDSAGRAVWDGAPEGDLYFSFHKSGYMRQDDVKVPADGVEHVVTLSPALLVSGTVLDAATSEPVPNFRIACGWPQPGLGGEVRPQFSNIERFWLSFSGGKFKHSFEESLIGGVPANPGYMLRFEAEGYAPALSRVIHANEGEVELEVKLVKAIDLAVSVLLPDGRPAANLQIGLASPGSNLRLVPGGLATSHSHSGNGMLRTDAQGIFKLPSDDAVDQVIAAGIAGYGQSTPAALRADPTLRLQAWGRIEGSFASGSKAAGRKLNLGPIETRLTSIQFDFMAFQVETDGEGKFNFAQVPPGRWHLVRLVSSMAPEGNSGMHVPIEEVEVQAGQTTQVSLGAGARSVVARVRFPSGLPRDAGTPLFASLHTPFAKPPAKLRGDPAALERWAQSPEVQPLLAKIRSYQLREGADGTWSAEEVPPGNYLLSVQLMAKQGTDRINWPAASAELSVSIPPGDNGQSFDAGEVVLQPTP